MPFLKKIALFAPLPEASLRTIAEVAEAYGISEAHLMKITHQLSA